MICLPVHVHVKVQGLCFVLMRVGLLVGGGGGGGWDIKPPKSKKMLTAI